jgi:hypothetical protein
MYNIHIYILVTRISRIIRYKLGVSVPRRPLQHTSDIYISIYISIYIYTSIYNICLVSLYTLLNHLFSTSNTQTLHPPLPVTSIPMPGIRAA